MLSKPQIPAYVN